MPILRRDPGGADRRCHADRDPGGARDATRGLSWAGALLLGAQVIAELEASSAAGMRWYEDPSQVTLSPPASTRTPS
jgi:hypothetical protein